MLSHLKMAVSGFKTPIYIMDSCSGSDSFGPGSNGSNSCNGWVLCVLITTMAVMVVMTVIYMLLL